MIDNVRHDFERRAATTRNELGAFVWLMRTAFLAALVGAVWVELRKPPEDRTWNGRLLGFVPYDFRLPTSSVCARPTGTRGRRRSSRRGPSASAGP